MTPKRNILFYKISISDQVSVINGIYLGTTRQSEIKTYIPYWKKYFLLFRPMQLPIQKQ
jgi:hypothetical protein